MIGPGTYLCGCAEDANSTHSWHLVPGTDPPQYTNRRYDDEGFMVCPWHGARRYGWRSVPASPNHPGPKSGYMSMTPLEIERRKYYGKSIPKKKELKIDSNAPDLRDTRDPEELGKEILARSNGHEKNLHFRQN